MSRRKEKTAEETQAPTIFTEPATEGYYAPDQFSPNPNRPRGRREAVEPEKLRKLAASIFRHGQLQPVEAGRNEDGSLDPIFGNSRIAAIQLIRDGFEISDPETGKPETLRDPERLVWAHVGGFDPATAFLRTVTENAARNETTDVDDAENQAYLRDHYGYNDSEIARAYGLNNTNRVAALRKLNAAPATLKEKVADDQLSLYGLTTLLDNVPEPADQVAVLQASLNPETGKYDGGEIRRQIRQRSENPVADDFEAPVTVVSEETEATPAPKKTRKPAEAEEPKATAIKRGVKDLRNLIESELADEETQESQKTFWKAFAKWIDGKASDKVLLARFAEVNV